MAGKALQPSNNPPLQAPIILMKQWKEEKQGMGRQGDAKWTTPQTTAQMLKEELADPSSVQSYHIPC